MIEEDISLDANPLDLLNEIFKKGVFTDLEENNFKINYFGEKTDEYLESLIKFYSADENSYEANIENVQSNLNNKEDIRNYIIYIKYKNIYIGGLSIFDFQSREGFGLNKYINNNGYKSFYIGHWEENKKNGIGFYKIDDNHLYFGNFKENQMIGEGIYFNKENENFFFGLFNNGEFKKGLYNNLNKNIYYIGNFVNDKKNDDFSIYINYEMKRIFIGKIQNDSFVKGIIAILKIEETKKNIILKIRNIVYKDNGNYSPILLKKNKYLEKFILNIVPIINNLEIILQNINELLIVLENIYNDNAYNNRIGRYNSIENSFSFENELIKNYEKYSKLLYNIQNQLIIQNIKSNIQL